MCKFGKIELDEQCKVVPLLFFPLTYLKIDEMRLSMSNSERGMEKEVWKNEDRIVSKKVNSSFFFYALGGIPTCQLFPSLSFSSCYGRCLFSALYPSSTLYLCFFYQWTEQPKMRAATNKLPANNSGAAAKHACV
jgi:hypothetical protein